MTSFVRKRFEKKRYNVLWELKSFNHQYLEIYTNVSECFKSLEFLIRKRISSFLSRGKIYCVLKIQLIDGMHDELTLNKELLNKLLKIIKYLRKIGYHGNVNFIDILRWPNVVYYKENNLIFSKDCILSQLDDVLESFISIRKSEGAGIKDFILEKLKFFCNDLKLIRNEVPDSIKFVKNKLKQKIIETNLNINESRFDQELFFFINKMDITEELDRLEFHIKQIYNALNKTKPVGKYLDFMMQELYREVNTISSKSCITKIINNSISMKILISQMREQIQNIE